MFQWPPLDVSAGEGMGGPQVNKLEQVSSDDHQMSVAGVGSQVLCLEDRFPGLMSGGSRSPGLMSEGRRRGGSSPGLMSEGFPVTYPMMHVMYIPLPMDRQTPVQI